MTFFIKRADADRSEVIFGHAVTSVQIFKQGTGGEERCSLLLVGNESRSWFIVRDKPTAQLPKLIALRNQIVDDIKANKAVIELDVSAL